MSKKFLTYDEVNAKLGSKTITGGAFANKEYILNTSLVESANLNKYNLVDYIPDDDIVIKQNIAILPISNIVLHPYSVKNYIFAQTKQFIVYKLGDDQYINEFDFKVSSDTANQILIYSDNTSSIKFAAASYVTKLGQTDAIGPGSLQEDEAAGLVYFQFAFIDTSVSTGDVVVLKAQLSNKYFLTIHLNVYK